MSLATRTNGSTKGNRTSPHWSQLPVHHFLATFNWDNRAVELQPQISITPEPIGQPLDLRLTVSQFFNAINWSGTAASQPIAAGSAREETSPVTSKRDTLTLNDFADLF
jgi:hypothetical protein